MPTRPKQLKVEQPAIGHLIRELRQLTKLSQEKFANQLGVTFPTINRWENGHAKPSPLALKQIYALLDQLGNSPDVLLRERSQTLQAKYCLAEKQEVGAMELKEKILGRC